MKKILFLLISIFILNNQYTFSQCREYIEAIAESELEPYILDGNFLSPIVSEGDEIELVRTFISGQKYKIAICGMEIFTKEITILDSNGKVIYKNFGQNFNQPQFITNEDGEMMPNSGINSYEFTAEKTQNLKIKVKISPLTDDMKYKIIGCLGILVGFQK